MLKGMTVNELRDLKLDVHDISIHQSRIQEGISEGRSLTIPIQDTCRLDNGGIVPSLYLKTLSRDKPRGFAAFVPAAGAASRYFKPLITLRQCLAENDRLGLEKEWLQLRQQQAQDWPLPKQLHQWVSASAMPELSQEQRQALLDEIDAPKALLPCWKNGPSFLQMKQREHQVIGGLEAEYFVVPIGQSERFRQLCQDSDSHLTPPIFLEQSEGLSTIRFHPHGEPYRDKDGKLSLVPAGHGMLVKLFRDIHKQKPQLHSLFIRNIDNVNGTSQEVLAETEVFLLQHQQVLHSLQAIRLELHQDALDKAAEQAQGLLDLLVIDLKQNLSISFPPLSYPWKPLWDLLLFAFHCPPQHALELRQKWQDKRALKELYDRPLNTLGQVPNSGKDIGGTPVFAQTSNGLVSLCLELPHVSAIDKQKFLEDPRKATHFNPVFVAAEIPTNAHAYDLERCPFWILSEKSIHGIPVVYHEIVLYEVIGNSLTANVMFPTVSRRLFRPHKTLLDGLEALS